jgi:hypothetical protein
MTDIFKLIEKHGIELHGDIEYFAELVRQDERGFRTPLSVLNLTVRAEHLLKRGRVQDVETLRAMDARDILAIPGMGKKTLGEINISLLEYENLNERKVMQKSREDRENVMRMAKEAAQFDGTTSLEKSVVLYAAMSKEFLEKFAALVRADEREVCAALCSATAAGRDAEAIEDAIRARGEQ